MNGREDGLRHGANSLLYFRADRIGKTNNQHTLVQDIHAAPQEKARFAGMVKAARQGRNVLTGATVDLRAPLALPAMTSVVVEW